MVAQSSHDLTGTRIIVTGAARGLGEHIARRAVARGARVGLIGLEPDALEKLAHPLGPATVWREADVRDGVALRRAMDECASELGGVDVVVANAGVLAYGTIAQIDETAFERVIDINLTGTFRTAKYATPHLIASRGHLLVVASALSFLAIGSMASYNASKAGAEMLALAYRTEVAHHGVTVGIAHPSWVDTDITRGIDSDIPSFAELKRRLPYPGNATTTVDAAATSIVDGLAGRKSRIYVPRATILAAVGKSFLHSPVVWPLARRLAIATIPRIEADIDRLGRVDQHLPTAPSPTSTQCPTSTGTSCPRP
ncbi:3-oxoacyl-[acyl-carrier-protein] reductase FabG1 [Rhodococcus sp. PBTS 1]|nr:3-oxoacyl-[acyl-carrier-protein] reductase FabG1 [Rhodococcus sp. PBTS 1]